MNGVTALRPELAEGSSFHRVLHDDAERGKSTTKLVKDSKIRRVVLCSGKVYFDLLEEREKRGIDDVYLMRVEQLYPFPLKSLAHELARFKGADVVWCQEEPQNQGAWFQIRHHLQACADGHHSLHYAGRVRSPAPACGHHDTHVAEQHALVQQALVDAVGDDHSAE